MFRKTAVCLSIAFLFISCGKDCYTAPEPVIFELVNAQGENLMQNGSITSVGINETGGAGVQLTKTADHKIILERVGSFSGTKDYTLYSAVRFVEFSIRSSHVTTDCEGFQIDELTFDSISATKEDGFYRIVLE